MGWTSCRSWATTKQAIEDESRPSAEWEIVWKSGNALIYRNKVSGVCVHTHFLTSRINGEIAVKDISDFRTVAAAKKFLALTKDMKERHINERAQATVFVEYELKQNKFKTLKRGDKVYIKDCYIYSGWAEVQYWLRGNRSIAVLFPNHPRPIKITKHMVNIDKTFATEGAV